MTSKDRYAHLSTLEEILKDSVLIANYRKAIMGNDVFKDKTVLDVGCGIGIFSMFAVKAGAKKVIGIDTSNIIDQAQTIIETNGFKDTIELVKGKLGEALLPIDKFDIIISGWMGYFLLYESMLDTVLLARDKYLKKGGLIFPDTATLYMVAIEDQDYKDEKLGFWDDVSGFDCSCIKDIAFREPLVDTVDIKAVVTDPVFIKAIDLNTVKKEDLTFSASFSLKSNREDYISAFVTWFDISFGPHTNRPVQFSTGPLAKYTHWKQTVFYTPSSVPVSKDQKINGTITCAPNAKNSRELDIGISYESASESSSYADAAQYKMS